MAKTQVVPRNAYSPRHPVKVDTGPGLTKQSFKDQCDIHKILSQYARTGRLTHVSSRPSMFIDVSDLPDYRSALQNVKEAEVLFMSLPSATRLQFKNDPAVFLDFCTDPENEGELRELGLLPPDDIPAVEEAPKEATPEAGGQAGEASASGAEEGSEA